MAVIGLVIAMKAIGPRSYQSKGAQFSELILNRVKRQVAAQGELTHIMLPCVRTKQELKHFGAHLREQDFDGGTVPLHELILILTA